ncbi:MAG TPA: hypothetical protein VF022_00755 [Rhodanobacteraceae bacterium]|jgi:hypothetical protein
MPFVTNPNAPADARLPVGFALNYAVFAAPLAWMAQLVFNYALSAHACFPHDLPLAVPVWGGLFWVVLGIDLFAIVLAGLGFLAALGQWKAWRGADLRHVGQRRNRYIAQWAILTSTLFSIAILFTIVMVFIEPVCNY